MLRTFRSRNRGQALVEMAILFPLFLLVIVGGIIDFGFAFYNLLTLQHINDDVCMRLAENSRYIPHTARDPDQDNYVAQSEAAKARANQLRPRWWLEEIKVYPASRPVQVPQFPEHHCVIVSMEYPSQTYTPFYQTLLSGLTGRPTIGLASRCVYKVPRHLITR